MAETTQKERDNIRRLWEAGGGVPIDVWPRRSRPAGQRRLDMTLTARVIEQLVVDDDAMITGYATAPGVAARLGESTQRVGRVLARLASRGEAVERVCFVRQGRPARWSRLYRVTRDARRAARRRGVLLAGPRVEDAATEAEVTAADFRLPAGNNCAIMGCKSRPAPPPVEGDDRRVPKT